MYRLLKMSNALLITAMLSFTAYGNNEHTTQNVELAQVQTNSSDDVAPEVADNEAEIEDSICIKPDVKGYSSVGCLHDGLAGAIKSEQTGEYNSVGYLDKDGTVFIPFDYDVMMGGDEGEESVFNDFSEGLAVVLKHDNGNERYGAIDQQGNVVIPFDYNFVNNFSEGLAVANKQGKTGAINKANETVIPFEYERLGDFHQGMAAAVKAFGNPEDHTYKSGLINKNNDIVIPFIYDDMHDYSKGLIAVKKGEKWGYVDKTNKILIPLSLDYEYVDDFSDGLAAVFDYFSTNNDNLAYGYIDKQGKLVIPMQYYLPYGSSMHKFSAFKNGFAVVTNENDEKKCINKKGKDSDCPKGIVINAWIDENYEN